MPWIGDEFSMKDGLSLVQWMNMQQNPSLANTMQSNYLQSLSGPVMQNLAGGDISRQLGLQPQMPQPNNIQFNTQRLPQQAQQLEQLQKLPPSVNQLGSIIPPPQQMSDITQQSRQNMVSQTLPSAQIQAQILQPQSLVQNNNILQQQPSVQTPQVPIQLPQNMQQQQHMMGQNQQQNLMQSQLPDQVQQHLQMNDKQIQLQLLQKLQQQQQSLLAQQSAIQQSASQQSILATQPGQLQDQHRQLLEAPQSFSRSVTPTQALDLPQVTSTSLPQSNLTSQQITKGNNNAANGRLTHPPQQPKLQQHQPGLLPEMLGHVGLPPTQITNQSTTAGSNVLTGATGAGQSVVTDDLPSCSTSPSTNNCQNAIPQMMHNRPNRNAATGDDMAQSTSTILCSSGLETISSNGNLVKDFHHRSDVKPSMNIPKNQNQGFLAPQTYFNGVTTQTDYLDTSSSTSVCLSHNDVHFQHNNNSLSCHPPAMLRDASQDGEVQVDPRSSVMYGANIDGSLGLPMNPDPLLTKGVMGMGKDFSNNISPGGLLTNFENSKDAQQELSSSIVSQSFGVPDMTFNSIDSSLNDSSFLNRGAWPPPPQFPQRMRTYTKVYILSVASVFSSLN